MARVVVLNEQDIRELLTLEACVDAVDAAFASLRRGTSRSFPVVRELVTQENGIFGIKSGHLADQGYLGLKAGGFWVGNRDKGLPPHQSVVVVVDPDTGQARAIIGGNNVTQLRTGAVGALAARYLAPKSAVKAAIIGCGVQGQIQTRALRLALPGIERFSCFDVSQATVDGYLEELSDLPIEQAATAEEAVADADVVVTTTPSWEPLVREEWVKASAHISAIGADTKGKQELDERLFASARVVVDNWAQAREIGESQHAVRAGILSEAQLYAELGELCTGEKDGRGDGYEGRTIFDATGIALQDLAAAGVALALAEEQGRGVWVDI